MNEPEIMDSYFRHLVGVGAMFRFLDGAKREGLGFSVKSDAITLDDAVSKRFAIGFPKRVGERVSLPPFIGFPYNEQQWAKEIRWARATVREEDRRIYLVSDYVTGDGERYPDIPQFAVAITTDTPAKALLVTKGTALDGRGYWHDENQELHVNMHKPLFSIPIVRIDKNTEVIGPDDRTTAKTMRDLMREKSLREDRYSYPA